MNKYLSSCFQFPYRQATSNLFIICLVLVISCNAPDPYSPVPNIGFKSLQYHEIGTIGDPGDQLDSLILEFNFQDGDGNIGINRDENEYPYHEFEFVLDNAGRMVTYSTTDIELPLHRFAPGTTGALDFSVSDNRPLFSCDDYEEIFINAARDTYVLQSDAGQLEEGQTEFVLDTVYIIKNKNFNNLSVQFFRKRAENDYELIDWTRVFDVFGCGPSFDGRFPVFDVESIGSSLEGSIKYKMVSSGFRQVIRTDAFRLEFNILDRNFNQSQTITTPDFFLDDILQ